MNRPRLRDVADLAQVSEPTVSRVLNGRPGVAAATRERVVGALSTLGFTGIPEPQQTSRGTIGVICGEFTNPVFSTWIHHLANQLGLNGFLATVAVVDPQLNPEQRCVEELAKSAAGLIFIGGDHARIQPELGLYQKLVEDALPVVLINGGDTGLGVPEVRCDEYSGAVQAVNHLLALGHSRIGMVLGGSGYIPTRRFKQGYHDSMTAAGLEPPPDSIAETYFTREAAMASTRRLIEQGITAVLTGNDLMALGAISAAHSAGLGVPEQFSVVGYDGTDFSGYTNPPLTTLRQPFEAMSRIATAALRSGIDGRAELNDQYIFEPTLVARASSGDLKN